MKKTICIFGISSMVGSNLAEFLKKYFKIVGTYYTTKIDIPEVLAIPCNILIKTEIEAVFHTFRPDYTIYAIGLSSITQAHRNNKMAEILHMTGPFHVMEYGQRYKSQICYLSSHFVFAGTHKNYLEIDMPDATTVLGKAQAAGEFYIQKASPNCLIFRCCKLYGRSINPSVLSGFFTSLEKNVSQGRRSSYDINLNTGLLDVYYLGMIMKMCFDNGVTNKLIQVSSKDITTHYNFVQEYCHIFGYSSENIQKTTWPFFVAKKESVSKQLSFKLDINNVESFFNITLPTVKESLHFTYKRLHGVQDIHAHQSKKDKEISYI